MKFRAFASGLSFTLLSVFMFSSFSGMGQQKDESLLKMDNDSRFCGAEPGIHYFNKALTTDTAHCYFWPYEGTEWLPHNITINTYNELGLLTEAVLKNYDTEADDYLPSRRFQYMYHEDDKIKQETYQIYNKNLPGTNWDNQMEENFSYNDQGDIEHIITRFSSWNDTSWRNGNQEFFYYGASGKKDSVLTKYWNTNENTWYYSYRHRYYYDAQGKLSEEYTDWANNLQGDFSMNIRTLYVRNNTENTLDEIRQYYYNDEWVNDEHYFSILDENAQPLDMLYQNWNPDENNWDTLIMMRFTYEYNAAGNEIFRKTQSHYIEWVDVERTMTSYYEDGAVSETLNQKWQSFYGKWENNQKCIFPPAQNFPTGSAETSLNKDLLIYPNPAQNMLRIKCEQPLHEMQVYSLTGNIILKKKLTGTDMQVNTEGLPNGIYTLKILSTNHAESRKLVVSR